MRIRRIELHGYKRMKLNDFRSIAVDFDEPIQQILGTNGSGKSSFLSELNPLPADHKDFEKGGKKHIWISHRGNEYECISDFTEGNKHTFIKNGITLNDKGNAKVQSELVYQEFKYDKKIRDLLLGRNKFTNMNASQRRDWFTELSDVNYDYAIHIFLKLKERLRDVTGSLREYKRRLVQESSKVLKDEEIEKIKREVSQLTNEITELMDKRDNPHLTIETAISHQESLIKEIQDLSRDLLRTYIKQPIFVDNLDELNEAILEVQKQIAACDALMEQHNKDYNAIHKEVSLLKQSGVDGLSQIEEKLEELLKLKQSKQNEIPVNPKFLFDDHINAKEGLRVVSEQLNDLSIKLPINVDRSINQTYFNKLRNDREEIYQKKKDYQAKLNKLQARKLHLEEHRDKDHIECPQCSYRWKLGFSEIDYSKTLEVINQLTKELEKLEVEEKQLIERMEYVQEYSALLRQYKNLSTSRPDLEPLWKYINDNHILTDDPKSIPRLLEEAKRIVAIQNEIHLIDEEIRKLEEIKKLTENTSLQNLSQANDRLDYYSLEMNKITKERLSLSIRESDLKSYKLELERIFAKDKHLEELLLKKRDLDEVTVKAIVFDEITKAIQVRQKQLALKEDILSEITNQKNLVKDLEVQIDRLTTDQEALNLLVEQISPKEGLIAQGLLGFMNNFISRVNKVISKVWTYPLQVKSCSVGGDENVELDYKFPLVVVDEGNIIDDVSMGSDGMKEIINLAFIIVAMHCLDMKDYPVMLDEFSSTFDETHRCAAVELVKNLLDQYSFSQLFIVSHYFTLHGALTNAQVCVLNDSNLSISTVVNKHVTFQ